MIFININAMARVLLTSNGETFSNLMGGGSYTYEITDQKSDDCSGEWFVGRLIWTGLQKTDNLCWRNAGSNLEVEIGDRDLTVETADLFYQKKNAEKVQEQRISEDRDRQFFAGKPIKEFPYQARMTCSYGSNQLPLMACMQNGNITTNIEVRSGQDYSMGQFTNLNIANSLGTKNGLIVLLRSEFQIRMQNASNQMAMNLEIVDRQTNAILYQKSAGQYGYITASNAVLTKASSAGSSENSPYEAEISCGTMLLVGQCLYGIGSFKTTIEIRSGSFYKMYQSTDLMNTNLLRVPLGNAFSIRAQNADNPYNLLTVKIKDKKTGKIIFEKSAGQLDYINIKN